MKTDFSGVLKKTARTLCGWNGFAKCPVSESQGPDSQMNGGVFLLLLRVEKQGFCARMVRKKEGRKQDARPGSVREALHGRKRRGNQQHW